MAAGGAAAAGSCQGGAAGAGGSLASGAAAISESRLIKPDATTPDDPSACTLCHNDGAAPSPVTAHFVPQRDLGTGAKSTRGRNWALLYAERYDGRNEAMSREWHLKRDRQFRRALWP
ncbi:MAG: hypothetical protein WCJ66_17815 [Verrucomicrobiota bacterium]